MSESQKLLNDLYAADPKARDVLKYIKAHAPDAKIAKVVINGELRLQREVLT